MRSALRRLGEAALAWVEAGWWWATRQAVRDARPAPPRGGRAGRRHARLLAADEPAPRHAVLADLVGDHLTVLTAVVERHRGVVFQYTGDGLLAVFLPELSGLGRAALLERLVQVALPELHAEFAALYRGWKREWRAEHGRGG